MHAKGSLDDKIEHEFPHFAIDLVEPGRRRGSVLRPPFGATLSFTTALAAGGQRFFADDRLFLDLTPVLLAGHSLAIAPKLRLPLPVDADAAHRDFVTQKSVLN